MAMQNQTIYTHIIRRTLKSYQHILPLYIYKDNVDYSRELSSLTKPTALMH